MIGLLYASIASAVIIGGILLARRLRNQAPGGYRRRFGDRHAQTDQSVFPATIYATGMDSAGHHHHQHHSADCPTHTDSGGGCSDGGGGS